LPNPAVGFDSIKLELGAFSTKFEGLLGVGIKTPDEESFNSKYLDAMDTLFSSIGVNRKRLVCKAADLARYIKNPEEMINQLTELFQKLNDEIERIDIYCTRFNSKKLPMITVYGQDRPESIRPVQFIRKISNGYPHICAWRYLSHFNDKDAAIYLDHFETENTPAWDFISQFPNINVLYKGDNCNSLLSSADLFIRLTVLLLKRFRANFNWRGLKTIHSTYVWNNKTSANTLGGQTYILRNMTPYNRTPIDTSAYINHPIVFIPHEKLGGWRAKEERDLFEIMPIYNILLNFMFKIRGSFKYFNSNDVRLIQKGDYMLVMGKNGEQVFNFLTAGGVPITKITLQYMLDNLKQKSK
jgi:hypothetical protein